MSEMLFPLRIKRQFAGALDPDMTFETDAQLQSYLNSPIRYAGQIATCQAHEGALFILSNDLSAWLPVSGSGGGGVVNIIAAETPPNPTTAPLWFNTLDGGMYYAYDDGESVQYVSIGGGGSSGGGGEGATVFVQESEPLVAAAGSIWFNPTTKQVKFYTTEFNAVTTDGGHF